MIWIDVDTAIVVPVNVNALVDAATAKVVDEGVTYNEAGMDLVWHFVTTAGVVTATDVTPTTGSMQDWAHKGAGMYTIEIPAAGGNDIDNDAEGFGYFTGNSTANLPWRGPTMGFRAAALNDLLIDSAFSATRGLAGTALPAVAADGVGGLVISDAGGFDIDNRAISAAAVVNLEDMFDGTGYFQDFAPAYQLQLAGLSGGLAVSQTAESRTKTQGSETLTVAVTATHDTNIWDITDSEAGVGIDFYVQFDIGAETALPVTFHLHGWFEDPAADSGVSIAIQAYNWNTTSWVTIETLQDGVAEEEHIVPLTINDVGTVASDPGIVRIRCVASSSAAANVMHINHMTVNYVSGLRTDSDGYILLSDGTGTGQIALASGKVDVSHLAGSTIQQSSGYIKVSAGTGTGQLSLSSGIIESDMTYIHGSALSETAGQLAAAFTKFFNKSTPTGTINSFPDVVAGVANGLFIAGTNAATTITGSLTTTFTGNLSGTIGGLAAQAKTDVQTASDAALDGLFLDQLLKNTYNPASPPGAADAMLPELTENNAGVVRFTTASLINAPGGAGSVQERWTRGGATWTRKVE